MEPELIAERYRLERQIGKGAVGEVWEAYDLLLQRTVAIKVVDLDANKDPAIAERFRREGIAVAGLDDPHIVKVYDTGVDANLAYLVMQLLNGPNLATLVRERGPVSYAVGIPLLAKVAAGLQAAHDINIAHRDVKPANIVLDAEPVADGTLPDLLDHPEFGHPTLVDFGIARLINATGAELTGSSTAIGTAAYMSPEQATGSSIGTASDVYSLGCVAYFLLLGRPPFTAETSVAVAHAQVYDEPVPLIELSPDAPPALDALITDMLAKDPADRPSAREVSKQMLAIAADPQMSPSKISRAGDSTPPEAAATATRVPMRRAGQIMIIVLIVLLSAGLVYVWARPRTVPAPSPTVTLTQTTVETSTAMSTPATSPPSMVSSTSATSPAPETTRTVTTTMTAPPSLPASSAPPPTRASTSQSSPTVAPSTTEPVSPTRPASPASSPKPASSPTPS